LGHKKGAVMLLAGLKNKNKNKNKKRSTSTNAKIKLNFRNWLT